MTTHFGFTTVEAGEDLSKNGYAALGRDRDMLDNLIYALFNRDFTGAPALGDPTDPPTLVMSASGGALPAGRTYYYVISYVDAAGLETAASAEVSVTTSAPIDAPTAPALAVIATGGILEAGTYNYVISFVDPAGGETTVSPLATIQITDGSINSIVLDLPDIDPAAALIRVYRSRPGQGSLYYLGQTTDLTFTDTGTIDEDSTRLPPSVNSTNSSNSIAITVPGAFIPEQAASWRVYRTETSGVWDSSSLVHNVVEPASGGSTVPMTSYTDTGDAPLAGQPRDQSATAPAAQKLNLANLVGVLPLSALPRGPQCLNANAAGAVTDGQVLLVTEIPGQLVPVRFTVYWRGTAPTTGDPVIRVQDASSNTLELTCSSAGHRAGDPAGLWRTEYSLMLAETFEAEQGTRSAPTLLIDNDLAASGEQAVTLGANGDWVQADFGALDTGDYSTFVRLRVTDYDVAHPGNDITISAIRTDTNAVLASTTANLQVTDPANPESVLTDFMYQELTGPVFTAPGSGVDIVLRVAKSTTSTQIYNVDTMRYTASVPTLDAGLTTVSVLGTTNGTDPHVCVWF